MSLTGGKLVVSSVESGTFFGTLGRPEHFNSADAAFQY